MENRVRRGRSKSIKKLDELEDARRDRLLEGARMDDKDGEDKNEDDGGRS